MLFSRKLRQIEIILSETSQIQSNTTFYLANPKFLQDIKSCIYNIHKHICHICKEVKLRQCRELEGAGGNKGIRG